MITMGPLLVFLAAAGIPALYIYVVSRWIEPEYRQVSTSPPQPAPKARASHEHVMGHPA
jgi:hypothetical protein